MLTHETTTVKASIVRLTIEIEAPTGATRYAVNAIDPGCAGRQAYELVKQATGKAKSETYHVVRTSAGLTTCTCADYLYRRDGTAETCKHGSALIHLGLLAAPAIEPRPDPVSCCTPCEAAPCAPAHYADEAPELSDAEAPELSDAEAFDPDAESDPATWPNCPALDGWFATPTAGAPDRLPRADLPRTPEPEPVDVPGVDSYQTFRPTLADMACNAATTMARPPLCRPVPPSRRTRTRWDRP